MWEAGVYVRTNWLQEGALTLIPYPLLLVYYIVLHAACSMNGLGFLITLLFISIRFNPIYVVDFDLT